MTSDEKRAVGIYSWEEEGVRIQKWEGYYLYSYGIIHGPLNPLLISIMCGSTDVVVAVAWCIPLLLR